jgi:hypothetical protein
MTDTDDHDSTIPSRVRSERSASVFKAFVERKRIELKEHQSTLHELERKALEAWFCCLSFSGELGLETDLDEARIELRRTETILEDATTTIARAQLRLEKYEQRLLSLTTGPRDL